MLFNIILYIKEIEFKYNYIIIYNKMDHNNQDNNEINNEDNNEINNQDNNEINNEINNQDNENLPELFNIFINIMNVDAHRQPIIFSNNINNLITQKLDEIIIDANNNIFTVSSNLINHIEYIYLWSLSYYDNTDDYISNTISKLYYENDIYTLKELTSGILNYSMSGINHIFFENYDLVLDKIKYNLRISLRFDMMMFIVNDINDINHNIINNEGQQNLEDIKLVVDEEEINKIPTYNYIELDDEIKEKNNICCICNEDYIIDNKVRKLNCSHVYHISCIDKWLKEYSYKCPFCRSEAAPHKPLT